MKYIMTYWAMPEKEDAAYLQTMNNNLSSRYDAVPFDPHLTIFGDQLIERSKAVRVLDEIVKGILPFDIKVDQINQSELFWKTVCIELKPNKNLTLLNKRLSEQFPHKDYTFLPHMSLLYQSLSKKTKKNIISRLCIKNTFRISTVAVIAAGQKKEDLYDIASWKIVKKIRLSV